MTVSTDQDVLVSEIHIAAKPERIFEALVDPAQVPQWWGEKGIYVCTRFEADLRVGGAWRASGTGRDGGSFEVKGEFLEIDRPHALAYTWTASWTGDAQTSVRWELVPTEHGTRVSVRHSGLAARPELAQSYRGWPRMLGWIRVFLEQGETVGMRLAV